MKEQTAVEWLVEKLLGVGIKDCPNGIIEQALEMERDQIEQAFDDGYSRMSGYDMSDDYYDSKYGNNKIEKL